VSKVINFLGAPGSGKTTVASDLFSKLKKDGYTVANVPEFATELIQQGRSHSVECQPYLFGEQVHRLESCVQYGYDFIICDSPLLLSAIYDRGYSTSFKQVILDTYIRFNNITYFMKVRPESYNQHGRLQSLRESLEVEQQIIYFLGSCAITFRYYEDLNSTYNYITRRHAHTSL
jgi:adenylate kinase family enzyme